MDTKTNTQLIEATKREFVKSLGHQTADDDWHKIASELYDIKMILKKYISMEKELKLKLTALSSEQTTFDFMFVWERRERLGTLDYAKIVKDYNVKTELYRKESIATWNLSKL